MVQRCRSRRFAGVADVTYLAAARIGQVVATDLRLAACCLRKIVQSFSAFFSAFARMAFSPPLLILFSAARDSSVIPVIFSRAVRYVAAVSVNDDGIFGFLSTLAKKSSA